MPSSLESDLDFDAFPPVTTAAWQAQIERDLHGAGFDDRLVWHTLDGFDVRPFYRADDLQHLAVTGPLPGRVGPVQIRQSIDAADSAEANRLAKAALAGGADCLGFVIDVRTDAAMRNVMHGIALQSQEDVRRLLDGLDLTAAALHLDAGAASFPLLAMVLNEAERQSIDVSTLSGSMGFDPLAILVRAGHLNLDAAFQRLASLIETHGAALPGIRLLTVDARPYHEAGGSASQVLAVALASLSEQFAVFTEHGLGTDLLAGTLHVVVPIDTSYFMEIAALRTLRQLAAQVLDAYGVEPQPPLLVQAETSRWHETLYDPHTNLLRATTEAAAAIVGGADVLAMRPFDSLSAPPTGFSARLARNIPLLLQHEAQLHRVLDPAAGSYYIEVLTDKLARTAWATFQDIEARGGLTSALREGYVQKLIDQTRERRERMIATRRQVFVGTSQFPDPDELRLAAVERLPAATPIADNAFDDFFASEAPMASYQNLLRRGASLGDLLRLPASGETTRVTPLPSARGASAFEAIRLATERYVAETGRSPSALLLQHGDPAWRSARAAFAKNALGTAGYRIEEAVYPSEGTFQTDADIVVLCSSDADYPDLVDAVGARIRKDVLLLVAGNPMQLPEGSLRTAGAHAFLYQGMDLPALLLDLHRRLGIG